MANNININVNLLLENAVKTLESFSSTTKKQLSGIESQFKKTNSNIESSFDSLKSAATAAIAAIGFGNIVHSGLEAQDAIDKLSSTLRFLGDSTPVGAFEELAEEIQNLTGTNDEFILSQTAMLKSLGATNSQVEQVIRVATDLSAALGQDLGTSVNQLAQSFSGSVPRGLGKIIPELKNLNSAQLAAGEGVDLLEKKLGGLSEKAATNIAVRFKVLKESISNVVEEFGKLIVNSPAFNAVIEGAISFANGLIGVIRNLPRFLPFLITEFQIFFEKIKGGFLEVVAIINNAIAELPLFGKALKKIENPAAAVVEKIKELEAIQSEILNDEFLSNTKKASESLKDIKDNAAGLGSSFQESADEAEKAAKKIEELFAKAGISKGLGKLTFEIAGGTQKDLGALSQTEEIFKEIGTAIGKGADGAKEAVTGVFKTAAIAFLGPLGQALGPVIDVLAQGPEKAKQFITEFVTAIPTIIENIILAIPALIQGLIEALPTLIQGLIDLLPTLVAKFAEQIPQIITAFANAMPKVAIALAAQAPFIAVRIATEFIKQIPNMMKEIGKGLVDAVKNAFGSIFGGGGEGGGGILSNIPIIGGLFAQGGLVPEGFPNDSFPARLTSGELVIDRSTTGRLLNFLDRAEAFTQSQAPQTQQQAGQSQVMTVNLMVSEENLASVMLDLNRRGFRTA